VPIAIANRDVSETRKQFRALIIRPYRKARGLREFTGDQFNKKTEGNAVRGWPQIDPLTAYPSLKKTFRASTLHFQSAKRISRAQTKRRPKLTQFPVAR